MIDQSLDEILEDFNPGPEKAASRFKTLTLWVPEEYKARYDRLQDRTSGQCCKKLREVILRAIEKMELKAH